MAALKLAIGNKNYSSWSMRPWLALRASDIPFVETLIPLYTDNPADKEQILSFSRAGKVPVLVDGETVVWDSLAIIEYIAECYSEKKLWPEEAAAPAQAPFGLRRDAFRFRAAAQRMRHEPAPADPPRDAVGGCQSQCRAHRGDLARVPGALWRQWTFPVRPLRRRGRHVCA